MGRKEGHMDEEKVSIVLRILKYEISIRAASREVGVGRETIRRWMARYEAEGAAGFLPREQNRVYSPETKRQAVEDYLAGRGSLLEISNSLTAATPVFQPCLSHLLKPKRPCPHLLVTHLVFQGHLSVVLPTGDTFSGYLDAFLLRRFPSLLHAASSP